MEPVHPTSSVPPDNDNHVSFDLPVFRSLAELQGNQPWLAYYNTLYKKPAFQADDFPLSPGTLWMLSTKLMDTCGIQYPTVTPDCPQLHNELFADMSGAHDPTGWAWLYKPERPYQGQSSNVFVEVTHCAFQSEVVSSWCYVLPGSGVFLYTGKTIVFPDHPDAVSYFLNETCQGTECPQFFALMFEKALSEGYDTVQFTAHDDMRCGNTAVEIVDLHGHGEAACGDKNPNTPEYQRRYRSGWGGCDVCVCDPSQGCLNCS